MTYLPPHNAQTDRDEITRFLNAHPFGTVVLQLNGAFHPTPLPLIYKPATDDSWGRFIGHVAIANPMWQADVNQEVLAIIDGPDAYITPNWYAAKAEHHRVVPTWNYATVHAWGAMTVHHDDKFKRMAVGLLTQIHERTSTEPWKMGDAPQDYLAGMLEKIVGIEIRIDRLVAKWKLSQNRDDADMQGVIDGLAERELPGDDALRAMMMDTQREP